MGTETRYDEKDRIIETRLTGEIQRQDVLEFVDAMIALTIQYNCLSWIVDYTNARYKLGTLEIFDLPREVFKKMDALGDRKRQVKRAIISIHDTPDFLFLENVAVNRGQHLRIFKSREAAVAWLFAGEDRGNAQ